MTLYMVVCSVDCEPGYILGVFSTATLADIVKDGFAKRQEHYADTIEVEEITLDKEYGAYDLPI